MAVPFDKSVICPVLIGRTPQLETINRLLNQAGQGQGQTLLIAGEAGLGKSRLVTETRLRATQRGWTILQGHCFETERGLPYAPIIDLLRAYSTARSPTEFAQSFGSALPELVTLLPELAAQLPKSASPAGAELDKYRLFYALTRFSTQLLSTDGHPPLLVIIEDLHWSDENSLELLLYLVRHLAVRPILFLFTYRSDEIGPELTYFLAQLDRERLAVEVLLAPLRQDQVDRMLQAIFNQPHPTRAEFLETLHTLTEGNPFFIEETLKSMLMAGDIFYAEDGIWDRKPLTELHIPRSVQDAVQRRSQQLSPETRQLLNLAAVAGRRFDFNLLQHLAHMDEPELLARLKDLMAAQFIIEESAETFTFRHALTREAIYATLLARERRQLHRVIGEILENLYGNAPGGVLNSRLADLADHFYRGEVWDKALDYAGRAGERALTLYAPQAAIEHFNHAVEATPHLTAPLPAQLLYQRGRAYATLNNFEAAQADYQAAINLAQHQADSQTEWQTLIALGDLWTTRDYARTGDYFQQAQKLARTLDDPTLIARSLNTMGNWQMNQGQPFAALRHHQEALSIFQTLSDTSGLAQTLDLLAIASYNCADVIQGRAYYQQALPLWQQLDDRRGLLHTLSGLALAIDFDLAYDDMRTSEAVAWAEKSVKVARDIGWRSGEVLTLICWGLVLRQQGQYGSALEVLQSTLAQAQEIEHYGWKADAGFSLGMVYLDLLALTEARTHLEEMLALAYQINSNIWINYVSIALASVYLLQKEFDLARVRLDAVLPADGPMLTLHQRFIWLTRAELALAEGQPQTALHIVERLINSAANLPPQSKRVIPHLWLVHGRALAQMKRLAEAETVLRAGLEAAQTQERRRLLWRLHAALGRVYLAQNKIEAAEQTLAAARSAIEELAVTLPDESEQLRHNFVQQAAAMLPVMPTRSPQEQAKQQFGGLTPREREVAVLVARGKTNRDIAEELILSERTAERHIANIMSKLGFNSRAQIAAWAVEKGISGDTNLIP